MAENVRRMEETINAYEMTIGKYKQSFLVSRPTHTHTHTHTHIYIYIYIYIIFYVALFFHDRGTRRG